MNAATATFWIVTDTIGLIPIEVNAQSSIAADAVSIPLLVKVFQTVLLNVTVVIHTNNTFAVYRG